MNVYVESNFVLELALMQEDQDACEHVLSLSSSGKIHLILPAFSLTEPYETLVRRGKARSQLAQSVQTELQQLGRSKSYKTEIDVYREVTGLLLRSGKEEAERLFQTRDRLLQSAQIIPLDRETLIFAAQLQGIHDLSPQDAVVLASTLQHLNDHRPDSSCFLNKNSRDFFDSDIEKALNQYGCKLFVSFALANKFITSQVQG